MATSAKSDPDATMVIRDITPSITTLSVPFEFAGGRVKSGGRATIVRLASGRLAIFSPVALTATVRSKLESLGTTQYIVAPNIAHHIHISAWAKAFPSAQIICGAGLVEKREQDPATRGTKFHHIFTQENSSQMEIANDFDNEFKWEYVTASSNQDIVFLHSPTKTLIQADLLLNLPSTEQYSKVRGGSSTGFLGRMVSSAFSTKGDMIWQKRALWHGVGSKKRESFSASMRNIQKWDFDRIIPCHGEVIETNAKGTWANLTEWFINGKK
ncbi:hypothetical protein NQ176_g4385 [Zarea fungicola]|uniref:Uncharacterized protein n=1 Tax=Zarea fungicola TaxID=93591 RepID=A0ACC1NEF0_9HYPO|nr:hypothetical protein NQ176_g4385 [Lecanicillium fungicola]